MTASWSHSPSGVNSLTLIIFDVRDVPHSSPLVCRVFVECPNGSWRLVDRSPPLAVFVKFQNAGEANKSEIVTWQRAVMGEREPQWKYLHTYSSDTREMKHEVMRIDLPKVKNQIVIKPIASLDELLKNKDSAVEIFQLAKLGIPNVARPWMWCELGNVPKLKRKLGKSYQFWLNKGLKFELTNLSQINQVASRVCRFLFVDLKFENKLSNILIALSVYSTLESQNIQKKSIQIFPTYSLGLFIGRLLMNFSGQQFSEDDIFFFVIALSCPNVESHRVPFEGLFGNSPYAYRDDCLFIRAGLKLLHPQFAESLKSSGIRLEDLLQSSLQCLFSDSLSSAALYKLWDIIFSAIPNTVSLANLTNSFHDLHRINLRHSGGCSFGICGCSRAFSQFAGEEIIGGNRSSSSSSSSTDDDVSTHFSASRQLLISFAFGVLLEAMPFVKSSSTAGDYIVAIRGILAATRDPALVVSTLERGSLALFCGAQRRYIADLAAGFKRAEAAEVQWPLKQSRVISEVVGKPQLVGVFNKESKSNKDKISFLSFPNGLTTAVLRQYAYPILKFFALFAPFEAFDAPGDGRLVVVVDFPKNEKIDSLKVRVKVDGDSSTFKCPMSLEPAAEFRFFEIRNLPVHLDILVDADGDEKRKKIEISSEVGLESFHDFELSDGSRVVVGLCLILGHKFNGENCSFGKGRWDTTQSARVKVNVDIENLVKNYHLELSGNKAAAENLIETTTTRYWDKPEGVGMTRAELGALLWNTLPMFLPYLDEIMRQFARVPDFQRDVTKCRLSIVEFLLTLILSAPGSSVDKCALLFDLFGSHARELPAMGLVTPTSTLPPELVSPHAVREGLLLDKHLPVGVPSYLWREDELTTNAIDVAGAAEVLRSLVAHRGTFVDFGTAVLAAARIFCNSNAPLAVTAAILGDGQPVNVTKSIARRIRVGTLIHGKPILDIKKNIKLSDWDLADPFPGKAKVLQLTVTNTAGDVTKSSVLIDKNGTFVDDLPLDLMPKPTYIDKYSFITRLIAETTFSDVLGLARPTLGLPRRAVAARALVEWTPSVAELHMLGEDELESLMRSGEKVEEERMEKDKRTELLTFELEGLEFDGTGTVDPNKDVVIIGTVGCLRVTSRPIAISSQSLKTKIVGTFQLPLNSSFEELTLSIEQRSTFGAITLGRARLSIAKLRKEFERSDDGVRLRIEFIRGVKTIAKLNATISFGQAAKSAVPTHLRVDLGDWNILNFDKSSGTCNPRSQSTPVTITLGHSRRSISSRGRVDFPYRLEKTIKFEVPIGGLKAKLIGKLDLLDLVKSNKFATSQTVPLYYDGEPDIIGYIHSTFLFQLPENSTIRPQWVDVSLRFGSLETSGFDKQYIFCRSYFLGHEGDTALTPPVVCQDRHFSSRSPISLACPNSSLSTSPNSSLPGLVVEVVAHANGQTIARGVISPKNVQTALDSSEWTGELSLEDAHHDGTRGSLDVKLSHGRVPTSLKCKENLVKVRIGEMRLDRIRESVAPLPFVCALKLLETPTDHRPSAPHLVVRSFDENGKVAWPVARLARQYSSDRWLCLGAVTVANDFSPVAYVDLWSLGQKKDIRVPLCVTAGDHLIVGEATMKIELMSQPPRQFAACRVTLASRIERLDAEFLPAEQFLYLRASMSNAPTEFAKLYKMKNSDFLLSHGATIPFAIVKFDLMDTRTPAAAPLASTEVSLDFADHSKLEICLYRGVPRCGLASATVEIEIIQKLFVPISLDTPKTTIYRDDILRHIVGKLSNAENSKFSSFVVSSAGKGPKRITSAAGVDFGGDEFREIGKPTDGEVKLVIENCPKDSSDPLEEFVAAVHLLGRDTRVVGTRASVASPFVRAMVDCSAAEAAIASVKWTANSENKLEKVALGGDVSKALDVSQPRGFSRRSDWEVEKWSRRES